MNILTPLSPSDFKTESNLNLIISSSESIDTGLFKYSSGVSHQSVIKTSLSAFNSSA
jgi:hypothetical protein